LTVPTGYSLLLPGLKYFRNLTAFNKPWIYSFAKKIQDEGTFIQYTKIIEAYTHKNKQTNT